MKSKDKMTVWMDGGVEFIPEQLPVPMWYMGRNSNPFDFLNDPEEDIYTFEDGEPIDEI